MDRDKAELWGGAVVIALAGGALLSPLFVNLQFTAVLLVLGVIGLAVGSLLIAFSRRGRAV